MVRLGARHSCPDVHSNARSHNTQSHNTRSHNTRSHNTLRRCVALHRVARANGTWQVHERAESQIYICLIVQSSFER